MQHLPITKRISISILFLLLSLLFSRDAYIKTISADIDRAVAYQLSPSTGKAALMEAVAKFQAADPDGIPGTQGKSNGVIADILTISEKTVEFQWSSTFRKLAVSSRTMAVLKAANMRLIAA